MYVLCTQALYLVPYHVRVRNTSFKNCVYVHTYTYVSEVFIAFLDVSRGPWDCKTDTDVAVPVVAGAMALVQTVVHSRQM